MSARVRAALLWHGDRETRKTASLEDIRMRGVAEALHQIGVASEPAIYVDEYVDEVRDELSAVDGVLVWVNPIGEFLTGCEQ
jgi:hypothetical protein